MINRIAIGLGKEVDKYRENEKFSKEFGESTLGVYQWNLYSKINRNWDRITKENRLEEFFDNLDSTLTTREEKDDPFITAYFQAAQKDVPLKNSYKDLANSEINKAFQVEKNKKPSALSPSLSQISLPLYERGTIIGIDAVKNTPGTKLNFVLDGLDMEKVVKNTYQYLELEKDNTPEFYFPFLAENLRYIYRNYELLKGKVAFFHKQALVQAPWLEKKELWKVHQPKNQAVDEKHAQTNSVKQKHEQQEIAPPNKQKLAEKLTEATKPAQMNNVRQKTKSFEEMSKSQAER